LKPIYENPGGFKDMLLKKKNYSLRGLNSLRKRNTRGNNYLYFPLLFAFLLYGYVVLLTFFP